MTPRNCDRCHTETEPTTVDSVRGESDPLRIILHGLPLLKCPEGHSQFIRPEFGAELLEHLIQEDEPELPAGEVKGLILKKYLCESCGEELEPKPDHRHSFSIEVPLEEIDPIRVELSMPVYRCSSCGKEQLHSLREVRKLTPAALAEAFKNADIPPPPGVI
jgi:DNA-directed RNA polymerase subunit RPC12/RpoP